jgi:hypothetical protein
MLNLVSYAEHLNSLRALTGNRNFCTVSGKSSGTAASAVLPPGGTSSDVWSSAEFI